MNYNINHLLPFLERYQQMVRMCSPRGYVMIMRKEKIMEAPAMIQEVKKFLILLAMSIQEMVIFYWNFLLLFTAIL